MRAEAAAKKETEKLRALVAEASKDRDVKQQRVEVLETQLQQLKEQLKTLQRERFNMDAAREQAEAGNNGEDPNGGMPLNAQERLMLHGIQRIQDQEQVCV